MYVFNDLYYQNYKDTKEELSFVSWRSIIYYKFVTIMITYILINKNKY
jgi:hypothetical protein